MKFWFALIAFSLFSTAHATDTSGCSPLVEHHSELQTRSGALLAVHSYKPRNEQCWNVNEATVEVSYRWAEEGINVTGTEVFFWLRVNDRVLQVKTAGNCKLVSDTGVSKNTGRPWYDCRAAVLVPVLTERTGRYRVEVAPRKSGQWDTWGFEQNYLFEL